MGSWALMGCTTTAGKCKDSTVARAGIGVESYLFSSQRRHRFDIVLHLVAYTPLPTHITVAQVLVQAQEPMGCLFQVPLQL